MGVSVGVAIGVRPSVAVAVGVAVGVCVDVAVEVGSVGFVSSWSAKAAGAAKPASATHPARATAWQVRRAIRATCMKSPEKFPVKGHSLAFEAART